MQSKFAPLIAVAATLLPIPALADIYTLFQDSADTSNFNRLAPDGGTYGAQVVDGSSTTGSGDALRIFDLQDVNSTVEVAFDVSHLTGGSQTALFGGIRIDLDYYNQSPTPVVSSNNDIRLRLSNPGSSIGTTANTNFHLTFESDRSLTALASDAGTWGAQGSYSTLVTSGDADAVHNIKLFMNLNAAGGDNVLFDFLGIERTLAPGQWEVYVDNMLAAESRYLVDGTGYDPTLGVGRIGIVGSSGTVGPDIIVDNWALYTGSDLSVVPEPGAIALMAGLLALGFAFHRRRSANKA